MTADVTVLPVDAETAERVAQLRNVCRGDPQISLRLPLMKSVVDPSARALTHPGAPSWPLLLLTGCEVTRVRLGA
jgi:hypothetical protein